MGVSSFIRLDVLMEDRRMRGMKSGSGGGEGGENELYGEGGSGE